MSSSNCCFLACIQISQEAGQVVWYLHFFKNFPQFVVIHIVKCFGIISKGEVDAFLELSCFFNDPVDVGSLISGSYFIYSIVPVLYILVVVMVQSPSHVWCFATPWTVAHQVSLSITISWNFPKFMSIASVMPSSHLILWSPLLLPSVFPSIRDFSSESAVHIRWLEYWSFVSVLPTNTQCWFPLNCLVWSPCCPRDSKESSPAPQFEGISSSAFCLLYSPALTTVCDHWEDHGLNYIDLC